MYADRRGDEAAHALKAMPLARWLTRAPTARSCTGKLPFRPLCRVGTPVGMRAKTELEHKYDVPTDFALPDLTRVAGVAAVDEPAEHHLDATYYDTSELGLARHQITLRRRTGGHDAGWHLKRKAADEAVS